VQLYHGPIVLPDGRVMGCSCVASMDAVDDLGIGQVLETPLGEIWRSQRLRDLRAGFAAATLNRTCGGCDMYRDLELFRTREGRARARLNRRRAAGAIVRRTEAARGPFAGG
jgi:radical SAM protein with 4Fe4S-binding SPASM domain